MAAPGVAMSRTKTSARPLESPAVRLEAEEVKATHRPSPEMDGPELAPLATPPVSDADTRAVVPSVRSRR